MGILALLIGIVPGSFSRYLAKIIFIILLFLRLCDLGDLSETN